MEIRGSSDAFSPALDLSTNCNFVTISFFHPRRSSFGGLESSDNIRINYTTDDGVTSTSIDIINGLELTTTFTKYTYQLSGISSNFKVMFDGAATSSSSDKLYIDNFLMSSSATSTEGDNLGNHTASENLQMSGNWISNDGGNEGIFIDAAGDVGIGTNSLTHRAEVNGGAAVNSLNPTRQALRINGGTVTGTNANGVIASSFINHGSGDGTAIITSFQGHAVTNDCDDTETMIGVHGFAETIDGVCTNYDNTTTSIGVFGEATAANSKCR